MKLTHEELAAMPAKTKKNPEVVALYLEHDFLTAYAMHTDLRVRQDGPAGAVGAVKDWERHGELQSAFLISQGLRRDDQLLEIGCGTGRLARKIVPWLDEGCYTGVDISTGALAAAKQLAVVEGWAERFPLFVPEIPPDARVDMAWAFSVFIHLPESEIVRVMRLVNGALRSDGEFLFSYVPEQADVRTGLKQFRHTWDTWVRCTEAAGFEFEQVTSWTGEQRIARAWKAA